MGQEKDLTMRILATALLIMLAQPAFAHTGTGLHWHGWEDGMLHPISGVDHLLAMIAVGLWAAYLGGSARWALPVAFLVAMIVGGVLGHAGISFPALELFILASIMALGAVLAFGFTLSASLGAAFCAAFALAHGMAHGAEMPADAAGLAYGLGFVTATALLHAAGLSAGRFGPNALRIAGAMIALIGVGLFAFL
jgi:urease accessory protein